MIVHGIGKKNSNQLLDVSFFTGEKPVARPGSEEKESVDSNWNTRSCLMDVSNNWYSKWAAAWCAALLSKAAVERTELDFNRLVSDLAHAREGIPNRKGVRSWMRRRTRVTLGHQ